MIDTQLSDGCAISAKVCLGSVRSWSERRGRHRHARAGYDDGVSEVTYTARQAADRLGLSVAMTRRYAAAFEEITGEPIRQHPRDGRQYRPDQLEVMLRAKAFVEANPRLSVFQALQLALGESPAVATPAVTEEPGGASGALAEALERSLLPELRALREEVAGLRSELRSRVLEQEAQYTLPSRTYDSSSPVEAERAVTDADQIRDQGPDQPPGSDRVIVRAARALERLLLGRE